MNNKGFTFVELLLTIVVLGIVISIAIPSYTGISKIIRENQRENIIKKIEIAASKYAYDTGDTLIFVDKLVTEGYIDSDDEDDNIKDPINNETMNCYIVEMEKSGDYYKARFVDNTKYDNSGDSEKCDISKLQKTSENVSIQVMNNSSVVSDTNKWLKGSVSLKVLTNNTLVIDCANNRCSWSSSSGSNNIGVDEININNDNGIFNTRYTFQYTVFDSESSSIERHTTSVNLKIDNEAPIIYNDQITVSNRFIYTNSKTVKIKASDGNGSGIAGYYLGINNGTNCASTSIASEYQTNNIFSVNESGEYLICVKDNVGNYGIGTIVINYIN